MLRLASVPYINALPLVAPLRSVAGISIRTEVPSALPVLLESGEADAILVSSIYPLLNPNLHLLRSVGIASFGAVDSVRIFSKVPIRAIESIALDQSSMTSNRLAMWLIEQEGGHPFAQPQPPDLAAMLERFDAAVLIGDAGMTDAPGLHVYDLGELWTARTGLPFLWAGWVSNAPLPPSVVAAMTAAPESTGLGKLLTGNHQKVKSAEILREAQGMTGLPFDRVEDYFQKSIVYQLDENTLAGYKRFADAIGAPHFPTITD